MKFPSLESPEQPGVTRLSDSPTEKQHTQEPFEEPQKEDYLKCVPGIRYTTGPLFLTIL